MLRSVKADTNPPRLPLPQSRNELSHALANEIGCSWRTTFRWTRNPKAVPATTAYACEQACLRVYGLTARQVRAAAGEVAFEITL